MNKHDEQVLKYINRIRKKYKLKPRKRIAKEIADDRYHCPLEATLLPLVTYVSNMNIITYPDALNLHVKNKRYYKVPKYVTDWINKFDQGKKGTYGYSGKATKQS